MMKDTGMLPADFLIEYEVLGVDEESFNKVGELHVRAATGYSTRRHRQCSTCFLG